MCLDDIVKKSGLCTGVAFDNFDRFVETSNGKDTLYDTVGIIFQNMTNFLNEESDSSSRDVEIVKKKKRRSFDPVTPELVPYMKKPRLMEKLLPIDNPLRSINSKHEKTFKQISFSWLLSHVLKIPETPMFIGFNSSIYTDLSKQQKVSYLTTINVSPTNKSVVRETMFMALKVADECEEKYIEVTYDLAIAKVALQIQSTDSPLFNRIFVHLGSFHVQMAFFKGISTFIDYCGITNILVDANVLAAGSVNLFLSRQHFNRCKKYIL